MRRYTGLALICLTVTLAGFPLVVGKPGLPMTLKADEPAYYLMALSLSRDRDLRCETQDLGRIFDEYPYLAAFNVILMTDDGWNSVFFGKPLVYPLLAAPFAGLFGANGMVTLNMLLLMGMVWMGTVYLSRFNPPPLAALYTVGFFVLSNAVAYVFWLHPEVFNMTCVAGSLFLVFHPFAGGPGIGRWSRLSRRLLGAGPRVALSGALLALAAYNKPMLAALAVPTLFLLWRRREVGRIALWLVAAVVAVAVVAGLSILWTGHPSAYLGVERMGVQVFDPQQMPMDPVEPVEAETAPTTNSWTWLARIPEVDATELRRHIGSFLWGRHTGLIPYMPFAVFSLGLFLAFSRRSPERWLLLLSIIAVALFFLIWIPFNWHGGGGFIGNRYFVNVYPAFLFLVTRIRPAWLTAVAYALGGVLLGPILFTPFGAPVPEPTLQAHVRNPPIRWFPLELEFRNKLPGYQGVAMSGAWIFGRKDAFQIKNDEMIIHGAMPVELWMVTWQPLAEEAVFEIGNRAPTNRVRIDLGGDRRALEFAGDRAVRSERIELRPREAPIPLKEERRTVFAYRLFVETDTGFIPNAARNKELQYPINDFYQGATLTYLGSPAELARDLYSVTWVEVDAPVQVVAEELFSVRVRLTNSSRETWPAEGPTRVNLSYHWLDPTGEQAVKDGRRTSLGRDIAPGAEIEIEQSVLAPSRAGTYQLELDLVRERVSWFSRKGPDQSYRTTVEVTASTATADSPEP